MKLHTIFKSVALLAVAASAYGRQSLILSRTPGSYTTPNEAPFNAVGDFRFEIRIHGFTPNSASNQYSNIWQVGNFALLRGGAGYETIRIHYSPSIVVAYVNGASDFIVRVQRFGSTGKFYVETFPTNGVGTLPKTEGPASTPMGPISLAGTRTIGSAGAEGLGIAWVRWYSTTVPVGSPTPPNVDTGDLASWDFQSPAGISSALQVALGNGATYVTTPLYAPVPSVTFKDTPTWQANEPTVRANVPVNLDGTSSYSLADDPALSYEWRQVSGPSTLNFSDTHAQTTQITGTVFGEYAIELAVTDAAGQTATKQVVFGSVETDDADVVKLPNQKISEIVGPMIRLGANPWPYADERNKVWADLLGGKQGTAYKDRWNVRLQGFGDATVSVTQGSKIISGSNTNFQQEFCGGGTKPVNAAKIVIWYEIAAGHYGRWRVPIVSCDSANQITGSAVWPERSGSAYSYSYLDDEDIGLWSGLFFNINYYDNVLAFYSLYYRSGLTRYLNYAHWLADRWWSYPAVDWGMQYVAGGELSAKLATRLQGLTGLLIRTIETDDPKMWAGMDRLWDYQVYEAKTRPTEVGEREAGLRMAFLSQCASFAKNLTQARSCRDRLNLWITQNWLPTQRPAGNWDNYLSSEPGSYGSTYNSKQATVMLGSNLVTVPASINWASALKTGNEILFYDSDGSWRPTAEMLDKVSYTAKVVNATTIELYDPVTKGPVPYLGATSSTKGWTVSNMVGWGTQPFMLGMVGTALGYAASALNSEHPDTADKVRSSLGKLSDWIREVGYNPADRGLFYGRGYINCEGGRQCLGGRGYSAETFGALSTEYSMAQGRVRKEFGDRLYGAVFGKLGGPESDNYSNNDLDNTGSVSLSIGKFFGFYFGYGFAAQWPAVRGPESSSTHAVAFRLADVPNATGVRLSVITSGLRTATTSCSTSPCTVTMNRQRSNKIQVEYVNSSGSVLAASEEQPVIQP